MIKHVLAVAAGKGGVGKSTVAVNLALALQKNGARVGLLDADLYGPSVRHMLPEERLPEQSATHPEKIFPALAKGISVISMAYFRNEQEAAIIRAPIANSAITQFIQSVEWGDLDFLIIDFPPGTGDIQLTLAQQGNLSGALLVTMPQALSRIDVLKAAHLFEQANIPILGIVENMHGLFPGDGGIFLSRATGAPLIAKLPFDPAICEAADRGADLFAENPLAPATRSFQELSLEVEKLLKSYEPIGKQLSFALKNSKVLRLEWEDGLIREIPLAELQRQCPCIQCQGKENNIDPEVEAEEVIAVGKYALRIGYRSGCSRGIYPFAMFHSWRIIG
jgi:ATP-binding protein involved in chromosome partitioning